MVMSFIDVRQKVDQPFFRSFLPLAFLSSGCFKDECIQSGDGWLFLNKACMSFAVVAALCAHTASFYSDSRSAHCEVPCLSCLSATDAPSLSRSSTSCCATWTLAL